MLLRARIFLMKSSAVTRYFEGWAHRYDEDMQAFSYAEPLKIFEALHPFIKTTDAPLKILDIGVGSGLTALPFREAYPQAHITGIDSSEAMLDMCRAKQVVDTLIKADVSQAPLPVEAETYDVVIAAGLLEYIKAPDVFITEIARVLQPGGLAAISFEPQSMRHAHKGGLFRGIIKETGHQTVIRSFVRRRLWPSTYLRYLYAPEAIQTLLQSNRFSILDCGVYDAYQWSPKAPPIQHHLFISRILL